MIMFSAGDGTPLKIWDLKGLRTLAVDNDPCKQEQRQKLCELVPTMPTSLEAIAISVSLTEEETQEFLLELWAEGKVAQVGDKLYQKMPRAGGGGFGSNYRIGIKFS